MRNETHEEHASDRAEDDELDAIVAKLKPKFTAGDLPLSDGDVKDAVRDAAEELRDAPVQTFVPIITENNARHRLQQEADEQLTDPLVLLRDPSADPGNVGLRKRHPTSSPTSSPPATAPVDHARG